MHKLFVMTVLIAFSSGLAGCNTWHGFGQDMEKAGEKIQKSPNN
jgi:predicted small secreted protein